MKDITTIIFSNNGTNTYSAEKGLRGRDISYGRNGASLLTQMIIYWLYKTPGRDAISPSLGGGLAELVYTPIKDRANTEQQIVMAVAATESQIKALQAGKDYPRDEMLKSLAIHPTKGIIYHEDTRRWEINVIAESLSNEQMIINVPIGDTNV